MVLKTFRFFRVFVGGMALALAAMGAFLPESNSTLAHILELAGALGSGTASAILLKAAWSSPV